MTNKNNRLIRLRAMQNRREQAIMNRQGRIWRLNPTGEMHGKEYVYEATSGHREIRIRWRESILYASGLKRPIDESQLALPARA
jgi:hypothetical protein